MKRKMFTLNKNKITIVNYSSEFIIQHDISDGGNAYIDKNGVFHGRNEFSNSDSEVSKPNPDSPGIQPDLDFTPDSEGKMYSFGMVADIHYDGDGDDEAYTQSDFKKAIILFNKSADFVCAAGDIGRDGRKNDYAVLKKALDTLNVPFYSVRGNHDNYEKDSATNYKAATGLEDDYVKNINDDIFIFLSMKNKDYASGGLSEEKLDWLEEQFNTYKNNRKFLIYHVFIPGTSGNGGGVYTSLMKESNALCKRFKSLVMAEERLIFCNGHSHLVFQSADKYSTANIYHKSGECYCVHVPSCTRPRNTAGVNDLKKGQCYLVDVYRDKVVFRGYDVVEQEFLTKYVYTINLENIQ